MTNQTINAVIIKDYYRKTDEGKLRLYLELILFNNTIHCISFTLNQIPLLFEAMSTPCNYSPGRKLALPHNIIQCRLKEVVTDTPLGKMKQSPVINGIRDNIHQDWIPVISDDEDPDYPSKIVEICDLIEDKTKEYETLFELAGEVDNYSENNHDLINERILTLKELQNLIKDNLKKDGFI